MLKNFLEKKVNLHISGFKYYLSNSLKSSPPLNYATGVSESDKRF